MDVGLLLLFLHITIMVAAITLVLGSALLFGLAVQTGRVTPIKSVSDLSRPLQPLIPLLFVIGGVFGLLTGIVYGYNLLAPWLVIAYVLFGFEMVTGVVIHAPFKRRVDVVLATYPEGTVGGELAAALNDRWERLLELLDPLVIGLLLFDMVVKPFS